MDKELLERVALAQRDYWRALAHKASDHVGTQSLEGFDPATASPSDWAWFWNGYVDPAKSL